MHNLVLSPIDPEILIKKISERVTENILSVLCDQKTSVAPTDDKDLLTVKEAAKFLTLEPSTIYSLVHHGRIPYMKPAKNLYFSKSDLRDYLIKNKRKSIQEIESEADSYIKSKHQK